MKKFVSKLITIVTAMAILTPCANAINPKIVKNILLLDSKYVEIIGISRITGNKQELDDWHQKIWEQFQKIPYKKEKIELALDIMKRHIKTCSFFLPRWYTLESLEYTRQHITDYAGSTIEYDYGVNIISIEVQCTDDVGKNFVGAFRF